MMHGLVVRPRISEKELIGTLANSPPGTGTRHSADIEVSGLCFETSLGLSHGTSDCRPVLAKHGGSIRKLGSMSASVRYEFDGTIATIVMDDGKVNALCLEMFGDLNAALDQALADHAVVVLAGRDGVFSAGFDLSVLRVGGPDAITMLQAGFSLADRLLSFPTPIVIACTGHAIAMGVFLLLSGDYRVGVRGASHKITANEVAIGLTMPRAAIEICRQRLHPAHFNRAVMLAEPYSPDTGVQAGFLDATVPGDALHSSVRAIAELLTTLDLAAHAATKMRARHDALSALRSAIKLDDAEWLSPEASIQSLK
jgi:enoyl-CoA hydratase